MQVFLTDALAASLTLADSRIMNADFLPGADGTFELDRPVNDAGVLLLHHISASNREFVVGIPSAPERPHVSKHIAMRLGQYSYRYHYSDLVRLFPGEMINLSYKRRASLQDQCDLLTQELAIATFLENLF